MNRQQRRFFTKYPPKPPKPNHKAPQLREMPTFALLATMNEIINVLQERGAEIRDWDHKGKVVRQFSSIGGKLYVLATKENTEAETNGKKQGSEDSSG